MGSNSCALPHPDLTKLSQLCRRRRGVLSLEDLPVTDSAFGQQAVILMPQALQITADTAKAALAKHLSAASLQALEVTVTAISWICYHSIMLRSCGSGASAYMQMLLFSNRTMDGLLRPCWLTNVADQVLSGGPILIPSLPDHQQDGS